MDESAVCVLLPAEILARTPSAADGIDAEDEFDQRAHSRAFIAKKTIVALRFCCKLLR